MIFVYFVYNLLMGLYVLIVNNWDVDDIVE